MPVEHLLLLIRDSAMANSLTSVKNLVREVRQSHWKQKMISWRRFFIPMKELPDKTCHLCKNKKSALFTKSGNNNPQCNEGFVDIRSFFKPFTGSATRTSSLTRKWNQDKLEVGGIFTTYTWRKRTEICRETNLPARSTKCILLIVSLGISPMNLAWKIFDTITTKLIINLVLFG